MTSTVCKNCPNINNSVFIRIIVLLSTVSLSAKLMTEFGAQNLQGGRNLAVGLPMQCTNKIESFLQHRSFTK